ncbi:MAG: hypothetical protein PHH37_04055 [Paludibacter sp.]|nr:hypothetical protein [Paludibacter sp.]
MNLKKQLLFVLSFFLFSNLFAEKTSVNYQLYGFVRNVLYFNSRQNVESIDGLYNLFPEPVEINTNGEDENAVPNAEMLSVHSRLGLNFSEESPVFGAKASAKIECDFAGFSSNFYLIRLRQAYIKLDWDKTELLVGQTWHPLFGNVSPTIPDLNAGAPFQPFNRSPQIRLKESLTNELSLTVAATYQMQYMSQGPDGKSASYMRNALIPDAFAGLEYRTSNWISGLGFDTKTLKINHQYHSSASLSVYSQYHKNKFLLKGKALWGQNMSDHIMLGGYGISGTDAVYNEDTYTNFDALTGWLNAVYGKELQIGLFAGLSQNLGTNKNLKADSNGAFTAYGYGFYQNTQEIADQFFRVSPSITYNIKNLSISADYELTSAVYGTIKADGRVADTYRVNNHRAVATITYNF